MEVEEIEGYVNEARQTWIEKGCTIMADGWTGPTKLSIINFMVYSGGKTVFLKSVSASGEIKEHKYIYKLLVSVIKEVGKHNVVHIVTDNSSNYKKVGLEVMKKYNIY